MIDEGDFWVPRWIAGLLWDGEISRSEALAMIFLADQIKGWKKKLGREYVRMTRSDWAQMLDMSEEGAVQVRDSLLKKGYLRRRKASEAPEAQQSQKRTGWQYTYIHPDQHKGLDMIRAAADPETRNRSSENGQGEYDDEIPF